MAERDRLEYRETAPTEALTPAESKPRADSGLSPSEIPQRVGPSRSLSRRGSGGMGDGRLATRGTVRRGSRSGVRRD